MAHINRKRLAELMSPWSADSGSALPLYAVGSYYYSNMKHPQRSMVERALEQVEKDIPRAERGVHGWTKKDAKELQTIARGLRYFLEADY